MDSLPDARRREIVEIRGSRTRKRRNQKRRRESKKALDIGFIPTPNGENKELVQEKERSDERVFETSSKSDHRKDNGAVSTAGTKDAPTAVSSPPFLLPQPSHTCVPAHSGVSEQHTAYSAQTRTALVGMSVPKIVGSKTFLPYEQSFTSAQLVVEDFKDVEEAWTTEEDDPASNL